MQIIRLVSEITFQCVSLGAIKLNKNLIVFTSFFEECKYVFNSMKLIVREVISLRKKEVLSNLILIVNLVCFLNSREAKKRTY